MQAYKQSFLIQSQSTIFQMKYGQEYIYVYIHTCITKTTMGHELSHLNMKKCTIRLDINQSYKY